MKPQRLSFKPHRTASLAGSVCLVVLAAALTACADSQSPEEAATPLPLLTMHDTMNWVLEPAADIIWDSAGYIITAEGEQDLTPTTDEGWHAVMHGAAVLMESSHLLRLPGRNAGDDWDEYARGLHSAGQLALDAALARDSDALFDAGGRIYQVCRACHNQYWIRSQDD